MIDIAAPATVVAPSETKQILRKACVHASGATYIVSMTLTDRSDEKPHSTALDSGSPPSPAVADVEAVHISTSAHRADSDRGRLNEERPIVKLSVNLLATFNNINAVGSRFVPLLTSLQKYYAAKKKRQAEEAKRQANKLKKLRQHRGHDDEDSNYLVQSDREHSLSHLLSDYQRF